MFKLIYILFISTLWLYSSYSNRLKSRSINIIKSILKLTKRSIPMFSDFLLNQIFIIWMKLYHHTFSNRFTHNLSKVVTSDCISMRQINRFIQKFGNCHQHARIIINWRYNFLFLRHHNLWSKKLLFKNFVTDSYSSISNKNDFKYFFILILYQPSIVIKSGFKQLNKSKQKILFFLLFVWKCFLFRNFYL